MQVDIEIGNHIAALLYTNEVVSIPGLGSFVTAYQPAEIDPVQGELSPPSKALKFDKNLAVDDGLLIKHISEEEQISMADAERLVNAYVEQLKEAIEKRELVSFSGLGRLYKDYEGQFQFLADGTNFNTDSYGLPNVQFFPISRLQQTTAHKGTANTAKAGYAGKKVADTKKAGLNKGLLAAMGLAVLVAGIAIYVLLFQGASSGSTVENAQTVPTSRVNVKPTMDSSAISHLAFFLPLRHQDTKFHEGKALTLCYSLCPLSLCGYFSPPHEKLLCCRSFGGGFQTGIFQDDVRVATP
jgi:hypothetical protein